MYAKPPPAATSNNNHRELTEPSGVLRTLSFLLKRGETTWRLKPCVRILHVLPATIPQSDSRTIPPALRFARSPSQPGVVIPRGIR